MITHKLLHVTELPKSKKSKLAMSG